MREPIGWTMLAALVLGGVGFALIDGWRRYRLAGLGTAVAIVVPLFAVVAVIALLIGP